LQEERGDTCEPGTIERRGRLRRRPFFDDVGSCDGGERVSLGRVFLLSSSARSASERGSWYLIDVCAFLMGTRIAQTRLDDEETIPADDEPAYVPYFFFI